MPLDGLASAGACLIDYRAGLRVLAVMTLAWRAIIVLLLASVFEAVFFFGVVHPFREMIFKIAKDFFPGVSSTDISTVIFWATVSSIVVAVLLAIAIVFSIKRRKHQYP